jgi:hypothetical protein
MFFSNLRKVLPGKFFPGDSTPSLPEYSLEQSGKRR